MHDGLLSNIIIRVVSMATREEKIATLAASLRASGLARSDSQAKMMAEDMVGVEDRVQKQFEDEHTKAQEYLKTAKNLRTPTPAVKPASTQINASPLQSQSGRIQPIPAKTFDESAHEKQVKLEAVKTDVSIGSGSLRDLMLDQINKGGQDLKPLEDLYEERLAAQKKAAQKAAEQSSVNAATPTAEPVVAVASPEVPPVSSVLQDSSTPVPSVAEPEVVTPSLADPTPEPTSVAEPQNIVLDSEKLTKMMEEDGPLEEHTREIKEKPKNVKPKEEYAENTIDLSNMFNFGKK